MLSALAQTAACSGRQALQQAAAVAALCSSSGSGALLLAALWAGQLQHSRRHICSSAASADQQQQQPAAASSAAPAAASSSSSSAAATASSDAVSSGGGGGGGGSLPVQQQQQHQRQQQYRKLRGTQLEAVRAAVFEHHVGDGRRSGRRALLRQLKGRHIASWYFTLTGPRLALLEDELEEDRVLRTQLARATGGGPPKKGQGKRSGKK